MLVRTTVHRVWKRDEDGRPIGNTPLEKGTLAIALRVYKQQADLASGPIEIMKVVLSDGEVAWLNTQFLEYI